MVTFTGKNVFLNIFIYDTNQHFWKKLSFQSSHNTTYFLIKIQQSWWKYNTKLRNIKILKILKMYFKTLKLSPASVTLRHIKAVRSVGKWSLRVTSLVYLGFSSFHSLVGSLTPRNTSLLTITTPTIKFQLSIQRQFTDHTTNLTGPIVPLFSSLPKPGKQVRVVQYNYINITRYAEIYADTCCVWVKIMTIKKACSCLWLS